MLIASTKGRWVGFSPIISTLKKLFIDNAVYRRWEIADIESDNADQTARPAVNVKNIT